MPTCAEVLARTLREAGIQRMFGLPGGEVLDFLEAARRAGIGFVLTRHEATASFMADVSGQIQRRPGVCVSTLGPGAVNMTLGVANAYLDRSPLIAITGAHARAAEPYATHQKLDLNAVYRPFSKLALTLDGVDTEGKVRRAIRASLTPRMGPVHIALPSDVARSPDRETGESASVAREPDPIPPAPEDAIEAVAAEIARARRPVVILGLDLEPRLGDAVRDLVEALGAPVFVTPKAKGMLPEDHPLFHGVCAGVAGDGVIVEFLARADLLVGLGFEPVESDKLWHQTMKLVALNPTTIAGGAYRPHREAVGELFEARRILEPAIAALAARRATREEVGEMERILEEQAREVAQGRTGMAQDSALHAAIAEAAHNRAIVRIVNALLDLLSQSREESLLTPGRPTRSHHDHRRMLRAIRRGDEAGAYRAMRTHLEAVEKLVTGSESFTRARPVKARSKGPRKVS